MFTKKRQDMRSSCLANHVTPATPVTETKKCLYISLHTPLFGALVGFLLVTMSEMTQNIQDIQDAHKRHTLWPEGQELGKLIAVYYYKALLRQNSRL